MLKPDQMNDLLDYLERHNRIEFLRLHLMIEIIMFEKLIERGIAIGRPFPYFSIVDKLRVSLNNPETYKIDHRIHFKRECLKDLQEDFRPVIIGVEVESDRLFNKFFDGRG